MRARASTKRRQKSELAKCTLALPGSPLSPSTLEGTHARCKGCAARYIVKRGPPTVPVNHPLAQHPRAPAARSPAHNLFCESFRAHAKFLPAQRCLLISLDPGSLPSQSKAACCGGALPRRWVCLNSQRQCSSDGSWLCRWWKQFSAQSQHKLFRWCLVERWRRRPTGCSQPHLGRTLFVAARVATRHHGVHGHRAGTGHPRHYYWWVRCGKLMCGRGEWF